MGSDSVVRDLEGELAEIPALDIHTHLTCGKLAARGLHDVLLYHMLVTDLYSAGCPSGARLTQYPGWPTREEAHSRIQEALPYLDRIRNTSLFWALRTILRDLYDWNEPITGKNWAGARRTDPRTRRRSRLVPRDYPPGGRQEAHHRALPARRRLR